MRNDGTPASNESLESQANPPQINTGGGPVIHGSVHIGDGDFVGRDKIIYIGGLKVPKSFLIWVSVALIVGILLLVVAIVVNQQIRQNTDDIGRKAESIDAKLGAPTVLVPTLTPTPTPEPMSDLPNFFNIAITQFGDVTNSNDYPSPSSINLSYALFKYINSEFDGIDDVGLEIDVVHNHIGVVKDKKEAEALANHLHADLVIYGTIVTNGEMAELYPDFWVGDHPDTEELTGQHRLDQPIPFTTANITSSATVNVNLRTRAITLVSLTKGLVYLQQKKTEQAILSFLHAQQQLADLGQCSPSTTHKGCELVYLLLGIAYSQSQNQGNAQRSFEKALEINPAYARAYIGLGNIFYDQATHDWSNVTALAAALDYYQKAQTASDAPPSAYVLQKVRVSIGNIYVIYAQQTKEERYFALAIESYNPVIKDYQQAQPVVRERMRQLVAIAYFGLGAAYERQWKIDEAKDAYAECIKLSDDPGLQQRAQTQIERIAADG